MNRASLICFTALLLVGSVIAVTLIQQAGIVIGTGSSNTLEAELSEKFNKAPDVTVGTVSFDTDSVMQIDIVINPDDLRDMMNNPEKKELHEASAVIDGKDFGKVGIRTRGNTSMKIAQEYNSCRFYMELRLDAYNKDNSYNGVKRLNLNFEVYGYRLLTNYIIYNMMKEMNIISPECCFGFMTVNGVDWGVCAVVEEIDKSFLKKNFENPNGNLYRSFESEDEVVGELIPESEEYWYFFRYLKLKTNTEAADNSAFKTMAKSVAERDGYEKYFDVSALLRYSAFNRVFGNFDDFSMVCKNFFLYEKDGVFIVIPWDVNRSMFVNGSIEAKSVFDIVLEEGTGSIIKDFGLFIMLTEQEKYRKEYEVYVLEAINLLEESKINALIDKAINLIDEYYQRDNTIPYPYEKWKNEIADGELWIYGNIKEAAQYYREQAFAQLKGYSDRYTVPDNYVHYTEDEIDEMIEDKDYFAILDEIEEAYEKYR